MTHKVARETHHENCDDGSLVLFVAINDPIEAHYSLVYRITAERAEISYEELRVQPTSGRFT
jgi:hypothetical protein